MSMYADAVAYQEAFQDVHIAYVMIFNLLKQCIDHQFLGLAVKRLIISVGTI